MDNSVSDKDSAFIFEVSPNTIRGYATKRGGELYKRKKGVPYPAEMNRLLEARIRSEESRGNKNNVRRLKEYHEMIIMGASYEDFIAYINSEREKGLSKKVLETEEKEKVSEIVKENDFSIESGDPTSKYEGSETETYHLEIEPQPEHEEPEEKQKKPSYPYLSKRELNMKLDDLVDLKLRKINALKKSKNLTPKKLEKIRELETEYRSIYNPWKDGVFNRN